MSQRVEALLQSEAQLRYLESLKDAAQVAVLSRKADGPIVISADDLVALSPAMQAARPEDGQEVYIALKPVADAARERVFQYLLRQPHEEGSTVVFTAGGPGSGKSTFGRGLSSAEFVYDSIFGNVSTAAGMIRAVLSTGRIVRVILIVRNPSEAMRGNLARALTEKRVASAVGMSEAHVASRAAFQALRLEFAGSSTVLFFAVESTGRDFRTMRPKDVPKLEFDETLRRVEHTLHGIVEGTDPAWSYGKLPEYVAAAARGTQRESGSDRA